MRVERHIVAAEPAGTVVLRNQQRRRRIDPRMFRRIIRSLADEILELGSYEIRVTLLSSTAMARLNHAALRHKGPTDVITFDYSDPLVAGVLSADIYICVEEAVRQAKQFRVRWPSELVRYVVHAFLHLSGYDDKQPVERRRMRRAENRMLKELEKRFYVSRLEKPVRNAP